MGDDGYVAVEPDPAAAAGRQRKLVALLKEQYVRGELTLVQYEAALAGLFQGPPSSGTALAPRRLEAAPQPPRPAVVDRRAALAVAGGLTLAFGTLGTAAATAVARRLTSGRRGAFGQALLLGPVPPAASPGEIIVQDDFGDPAIGWLPNSSPDSAPFVHGYEGDEYVIRRLDTVPAGKRLFTADVAGTYSDVSIAVDVRLLGDTAHRYASLTCRGHSARGGYNSYRLSVDPDRGRFRLARWDGNRERKLVEQPSAAIQRGNETNRLELTATGSAISASINGAPVASIQDGAYRTGALLIGAGVLDGRPLSIDARFDNLEVRQG